MLKKIINWSGVVGWAGLIFLLSHQPDLKSGLDFKWDLLFRKLAHLTEYFILTYLLSRALSQHRLKNSRVIVWALLLALLYAASDEYHQSFILNRRGAWTDVLIDSLGVFLAGWWLIRRNNNLSFLPKRLKKRFD